MSKSAYAIKILSRAARDLDDICAYHAGTHKIKKLLDALDNILINIAQTPYMYPEHNKQYRKITVEDYLVFYKVFPALKTIRIYRILHAKRDNSLYLQAPSNN
ncbi:MAG: type II toxin-antitoxin system RelE/ParE family toxin [Candidatus Margulisbacteria bacterium]|jgi:plasmid stabilization system protein ParE|nr:type II toxin-antitoxin system RelE/ParE family toxin [Candidatus Margulisiibacteriota bacterium]